MPTKAELEQENAELREMSRALLEKIGGVVEKPVVPAVPEVSVDDEQIAVLKKTGNVDIKQKDGWIYMGINTENRIETKSGSTTTVAASGRARINKAKYLRGEGTELLPFIPYTNQQGDKCWPDAVVIEGDDLPENKQYLITCKVNIIDKNKKK